MSVDLKAKPFCLNSSQIRWVQNTLFSMSEDEKIGQLFYLLLSHRMRIICVIEEQTCLKRRKQNGCASRKA